MTIFNWVQKKLHQNVTKDGEKKKKRSEGASEIEKNTKSMLDQVGLVDALDNWFDGVLTIGTFGFDTLKFQEEDEMRSRDGDECDSVDLDYVVVDGSIIKNVVDQELDPLLISNGNKVYDHHGDFGILDHIDSIKTIERPMVSTEIEVEPELEKKRTTLKELFMEDQNNDTRHCKKPKNTNLDEEVQNRNHKGSKLRSKFSFAKKKKMIKSKSKDDDEEEEDLRPIKKMRQMMKRMLKKKIHPDIDTVQAGKKEIPYKPNRRCEALESIYLLNDNNGH